MPDECGASDSDCLAKARPRSRAAMISGEAPSLPVASAGAARAMAMLASRSLRLCGLISFNRSATFAKGINDAHLVSTYSNSGLL